MKVSLTLLILFNIVSTPLLSLAQEGTKMYPVEMGIYDAGLFSYNDSKNNSVYSNAYNLGDQLYRGQQSGDIYYRFTVQGSAQVSISTCGSDFDTYIHMLNSDGSPLEHNDDNGPLCEGSRASIRITVLKGTYYIVMEGYGTGSGQIITTVGFEVQATAPNVARDIKNYVKTWDALSPQESVGGLVQGTMRESRQSAVYLDGLGRPVQTVVRQGSLASATGLASDLVSPVVYDPFGRQVNQYLPYAAGDDKGSYKDNVLAAQNSFYTAAASPLSGQGESHFYSITQYEPSPLGRTVSMMAPGASWAGSGHGVATAYLASDAQDSVRIWEVTAHPGDFGSYSAGAIYPAGALYKNLSTDEQGKRMIEYKNKQGQVILKKSQERVLPSAGHWGWLCTYYIYDDQNHLRAVLPPGAVEGMNNSGDWSMSPVVLDEQCFRYEYNPRGLMIQKKVPGAAPVHMVYDNRDRLVLSQDGNMRTSGTWLATVYDDLSRPVRTGLWKDGHDLLYHGARSSTTAQYPDTALGWELLTESHYDDYQGLPAGLSATLVPGYEKALVTVDGQYADPITASPQTRGLVTWSVTKVLGQDKYLSSVTLYDDKGRALQSQSINYSGGTDILTCRYDFTGKLLGSHLRQQKMGTLPRILELATRNSYDDLGRLERVEKNMDNTAWTVLAEYEYDALGQLTRKKLAPYYDQGRGLESLLYEYNIRGWLLGVNRAYLRTGEGSGYDKHFFGFELGYDKTASVAGMAFSTPQLNGNIAGTVWKSAGDQTRRKYDFSYDVANRFGRADFSQDVAVPGAGFSVGGTGAGQGPLVGYDANGNILDMQQHGIRGSGPGMVIDALHYTYFPNSNKLAQVTDDNNDKDSRLGDFHYDPATKTPVDYGYDRNGNLVTDLNKHIRGVTGTGLDGGAIVYNHLNLPVSIPVAAKGSIEYVYDASGNKLAKTVHENGKPDKTTLYMSGIIYEEDQLQSLSHEEGRARPLTNGNGQPAGYAYDYFIKDHLGNVRAVLTDEQQQEAYPAASLEESSLAQEQLFYRVPEDGSRAAVTNVPGYPQGDSYTTNEYVQQLNGNSHQVGTSILLKVMAGDRVNIRASSWYRQQAGSNGPSQSALAHIVASLAQAMTGSPLAKAVPLAQGQALSSGVASFLTSQQNDPSDPLKPKSYLNWVLLDEQLQPVITHDGHNSGSDPVGDDQQLKQHEIIGQELTKSGYLYIYLSNESTATNVIFDNLQVTHIRGPILEETHYYPFGLTIAGISYKAAGKLENRKKYNGIEFNEDLDLDTYDAFYRNLDPQLGRWWQIDPKVDLNINPDLTNENKSIPEDLESASPYSAMGNNPIRFSDPKGDIFGLDNLVGAAIGVVIDYGFQVGENLSAGKSLKESLVQIDGTRIATAAVIGFVTDGIANIAGTALSKTGTAVASRLESTVAKLSQDNIIKQGRKLGNDIVKSSLENYKSPTHAKLIKNIVKNASKDGVRISDKKIDQLKRVVEISGGKVRTEVGTTKNIKGLLHSQVEGYGTQVSSRHIIHANQ